MIRPEAHQWNWKPKTKNKDDLTLDKELETIRKKLNVRKNELTRMALFFYTLSISKPIFNSQRLKSNQEVN